MAEQSEVLLRYKVDQASVQQALAADRQIQEQLNKTGQAGVKLADVNEKLNASLAVGLRSQSIDAITEEFQQVIRETGDLDDALVRVERRLRAIGATDAEIKRVGLSVASIREQETSQRTLGQNITRVGRGLFNAPAVGPSTSIARGLISGGAVVDKLGGDLKTLAAGSVIATVGVVALALALDHFTESIAENRKHLAGAIAAQRNYYDALANMSDEQAKAQIEMLRRNRSILEQQVQEAQNALNSAFAMAQQTHLGDIGARALFNQLPTGQLQEAFDQASAALQENIQTEARLTQGREAGVFAANSAAEAEAELARLRDERTQIRANAELTFAREVASASGMSAQERQEEVDQIKNNIEALEDYRDNHYLSAEAVNQLSTEISGLMFRMTAIQSVTSGWKDELLRLEARQQAISDQTDAYFEALEKEGEIRGEIAEATQAIAQAEAEAAAKLTQLTQDKNQRLEDLEEDKAARIETIAQNSADRIAKIQRDLARDAFTAQAERNVLANVKAEQHAADALDDQEKADKRQLEQLEKQLDKQERSIDRSFERQAQQVAQSLASQVATQRQGLMQLNVDLQNAQFAQQAIALHGSNGQRIIQTQMWTDLYDIAAGWAVNISNVVGGVLGSVVNFAQQRQQVATQAYVNRQIDSAARVIFSGQRRRTEF